MTEASPGAASACGEWAGPEGEIGRYVRAESERTLRSYEAQPTLVVEHANLEDDTAGGGYADRQVVELIQNGADALSGAAGAGCGRGRIEIRLTDRCLYCADDGEALDEEGARALMFSHLSPKQQAREIGMFGLGFKAVLGVSDAPEFYSRSGSFRFARGHALERIRAVVPDTARGPVLRLAEPVIPDEAAREDEVLRDLLGWATNIVLLPLKPGAREHLARQMAEFPAPFLLFAGQVRELTLSGHRDSARGGAAGPGEAAATRFEVERRDAVHHSLARDGVAREWEVFHRVHRLSDAAAGEWRPGRGRTEIPLWWAYPADRRDRDRYRHFWAYFPTGTASLVPGILNAPWKTNEDRQNLLPGAYNDELIRAAADLVIEALPALGTEEDPARHLDALPRRREAGDSDQSERLRDLLISRVKYRRIVPDQRGVLRQVEEVRYPPTGASPAALERWAAYPRRPPNWLHPSGARRERLATIERLLPRHGRKKPQLPAASSAHWLEALFEKVPKREVPEAAKAALQTAALLPGEAWGWDGVGDIALSASGKRVGVSAGKLFLPGDGEGNGDAERAELPPDSVVHPALAGDRETRAALVELGIGPPPPEAAFRLAAAALFEPLTQPDTPVLERFWKRLHAIAPERRPEAVEEMRKEYFSDEWRKTRLERRLWVRTMAGVFRRTDSALLPGAIRAADDEEDAACIVDTDFHESDAALLGRLGAVERPSAPRDLSAEPWYSEYRRERVEEYREECHRRRDGRPRADYCELRNRKGAGPLTVLSLLSPEGAERYTRALLRLEASFSDWTMAHKTGNYLSTSLRNPVLDFVEEHGRIRTAAGVVPFREALGSPPGNEEALRVLLRYPQAARIREAFDLADPTPVFFGEGEPEPLVDVWPGLERHLPEDRKECDLRPCERIRGLDDLHCAFHRGDVYLVRSGDDREDLAAVAEELDLDLPNTELRDIADGRTPAEVERRRAAIRDLPTTAERLLAAVGVENLLQRLPPSLLEHLDGSGAGMDPRRIAEAAVAVFHTDALREYRHCLADLAPPRQLAGSWPAVAFVESLGFPVEWAGERGRKREPYLEVEGRFRLPPLHDYQQDIVDRVRDLLRKGTAAPKARRGMISLPTGAGKTRVAVEAIVGAIVAGDFEGGVLWVADRDELCEQGVQAWREAWSATGAQGIRLRISRMWGNQPGAVETGGPQVVVATIQTLSRRLQQPAYDFLRRFRLVVFDEAHRTLAPTFTSAMEELGLKYRREADEPYLLGLTATPYRGYSEEETRWLVNRYGKNRLDAGAFAADDSETVVAELQRQKVLAEADQRVIPGMELEMTPDERLEMERRPQWLPEEVERRIGRDPERTERILDALLRRRPETGPTLIFATSVENAETISALLNLRGVVARAVSGGTHRGTRRRIVEGFRAGEIEVLVNYGVFREGFDAPKTRTIIVARPVYSPNLYFQMIGRGLRGTKNGGNDRCLILNVEDNILNFDRRLAFTDLDWLWAARGEHGAVRRVAGSAAESPARRGRAETLRT